MRLFLALCLLYCVIACDTPNLTQQQEGHKGKANHLVNESSPYLLQHAYNPVDWYAWKPEALDKAKAENKLMVISIGYAACHWCHVMEHESFEDSLVSEIMNEHFVSIKVDREERPDIDDVYMSACHLATQKSCGWPLNAFALPDGRPVWAGTYFPKKQWMEVLNYFKDLYQKDPQKLEQYASDLAEGIQQMDEVNFNKNDQQFNQKGIEALTDRFLSTIDKKEGGREGSPKFPMPNNYEFLLQYYYHFQSPEALEAVNTTLEKMALGGIYDQLGGGFARYSTDEIWKVPHFEKMLYDNGQLVSLYANAYKLNQKPLYRNVIEESLAFVERELTSPEGGFYSSLDADSEGEEGKFYVWKKSEIEAVLGDEEMSKLFCDYFDVKEKGNWEEEKNILLRKASKESIMKRYKLSEQELEGKIAEAKAKLMQARAKRVRPGLDDKVLTSWNALMLKGYIDAYEALGTPEYLQTALKNANFLTQQMLQKDNRLLRNFKSGKASINAFLDDYALTIDAFIALYQVTFDEAWLFKADELLQYVQAHFFDENSGMYHYTSDLDPPLIARKMELADNVIPASNSILAHDLYLLGTLLYRPEYIDRSRQMLHNLSQTLEESPSPSFYSNWCRLYLRILRPPYEVAILGNDYAPQRQTLLAQYLPNALFLGGQSEGKLELLKDKLQEGATMIYVCQNKVCKFPVEEAKEALPLIEP